MQGDLKRDCVYPFLFRFKESINKEVSIRP